MYPSKHDRIPDRILSHDTKNLLMSRSTHRGSRHQISTGLRRACPRHLSRNLWGSLMNLQEEAEVVQSRPVVVGALSRP